MKTSVTDLVVHCMEGIQPAVGVGRFSTVAGVTLSYEYDIAAGGTIVLVAIGVYVAATSGVRLRRRISSALYDSTSTPETPVTTKADGGNEPD